MYLIGGSSQDVHGEVKYDTLTYKIDLATGELNQCADMHDGRTFFGICFIGHQIFVAGGWLPNDGFEVYNILGNHWQRLSADLPAAIGGHALVAAKKRYIYAFGGREARLMKCDETLIARYDTYRPKKPWHPIKMVEPLTGIRTQLGVIFMDQVGDNLEFLIFGGWKDAYDKVLSDETYIFTTSIADPDASKCVCLPCRMCAEDRHYNNTAFQMGSSLPLDFMEAHGIAEKEKIDLIEDTKLRRCNLYGVIGRYAFHVFDRTNLTWITAADKLGYANLANSF